MPTGSSRCRSQTRSSRTESRQLPGAGGRPQAIPTAEGAALLAGQEIAEEWAFGRPAPAGVHTGCGSGDRPEVEEEAWEGGRRAVPHMGGTADCVIGHSGNLAEWAALLYLMRRSRLGEIPQLAPQHTFCKWPSQDSHPEIPFPLVI